MSISTQRAIAFTVNLALLHGTLSMHNLAYDLPVVYPAGA